MKESENSNTFSLSSESRDSNSYRLFPGKVIHVDYERMALVIEDLRSKNTFIKDVVDFPDLPEEGARCLCCTLDDRGGYTRVAVVAFILSGAHNGLQSVASRFIKGKEVEGWSTRKRGLYRKAYPGEKTVWNPLGYTERVGSAWDHQALDLSRDKLDPFRRTRTELTGRSVRLTDNSLTQSGPVVRASGPDCFDVTLPDGSVENILYLQQTYQSGIDPRKRYTDGVQDLTALTEHVSRVSEYALDFPLPMEILDDPETLDQLMGLTLPVGQWWSRTSTKDIHGIQCDDQSEMIIQGVDHPDDTTKKPIGPTTKEGSTPRRRGWIIEKSEGTLVGYNQFDTSTYGKVLKPVLFPYTHKGRFSNDVESSYLPINPSKDHSEVKLAASAWAMRFPYEYNTTRVDVTKEGMLSFEIGSTLPKENIKWDGGSYEHPHGAGRSIEGHTLGSVKLVLGKNRDEEESLDISALGSTVLRLGADDSSLPTTRRNMLTQIRGKKDSVAARDLQSWSKAKLVPGDAGDLENKTGAENVSLRASTDGGMFLRLGARDLSSKRRHLMNGYQDGPGTQRWSPSDPARKDSKTNGRPTYSGSGDSVYRFHDMTKVTEPKLNISPYVNSGDPTNGAMDVMGSSADIHAVRDILLRVGQHETSGQSLSLDLAGGLLAAIGKDKQGRSLSASLDGGMEMTIGKNNQKKAVRLEIDGDVDIVIKGNLNLNVTGDISEESASMIQMAKLKHVLRATKVIRTALTGIIDEAPEIVHNQGNYSSSE